MALTEQQLAFIADNPFVGVLTDVRPDGSLHSTIVWVDVVGDQVGFNTAVGRAKERYIRADPRVSLVVVDPADTHKWVSISGRAEFVEEGSDAQIDQLAKKYLGLDSYPYRTETEVRIGVRIAAEHIDSAGFEEAAT
jgi:PPOX class probable F420-dependent enzyme